MAADIEPSLSTSDRRSSLHALDRAMEYLRRNAGRMALEYSVAMAPFSVVVLMILDLVSMSYRGALREACALLTLSTVWRWLWLARLQRKVQEDLKGEPPLRLRSRWASILFLRAASNFGLVWGSLLVFPGFYAFFLSGFATPLLLEAEGRAPSLAAQSLGWIHKSAARLSKALCALTVLCLLLSLGVLILHMVLLDLVLPRLLNVDVSDLALTIHTRTWQLCVGYFLFLAFDFYWSVASVLLFYDLEARRLGSDLRLRLIKLKEGEA